MTRVAFVIQRYGPQVIGGAEIYARQLAHSLHNELGWAIDVHTSCSRDYMLWDNTEAAGRQQDESVNVFRYLSRTPPRLLFKIYKRFFRALRFLGPVPRIFEYWWIKLQGPFCPDLIQALRSEPKRYDAIFAFTYLYYPTREVGRRLGEKVILVPFAHDEEAFHFATSESLFQSVHCMVPASSAERNLIQQTYPALATSLMAPAGAGVDPSYLARPLQRDRRRQLLYLGRVGKGKNVDQLLQDFAGLRAAFPDLRLILAGKLDKGFVVPSWQGVEYRGSVSDAEKLQLIEESLALINPSEHESLSLVVLEALALGTPVLANAACPVFQDFARNASALSLYRDLPQLQECLARISKPDYQSLEAAREYVARNYSWAQTCKVYEQALQAVTSRC